LEGVTTRFFPRPFVFAAHSRTWSGSK